MRRSIGWFLLLGALALRPAVAAAQDNPFSSCGPDDVVRFQGSTPELIPERPGARRLTLTGSVVIPCKDMTLYADTVIYEDDTEIVQAIGHVTLQQADLLIYADRAEINRLTRLGTFYDARGSARLANQPTEKSLFGTLEPDVLFFGDEISKTGPKTYRIHDGGFTTCVQPTPRWEMSTSDGTITLDKHALLRNVVLRVKDVPLLFLPAIYYPINKEDRSTGFLLPTYGSSTLRGTSLSNAFFLALGRSQDATFYHDWFSKTGQGIGTEYRYVQSRASRGNVRFYTLRERAIFGPDGQTVATPAHTSYRVDGDVNQALPHRFRLVGRANFFTDASTQQAYQNISDFSQRERYFSGTLSGNIGRLRLSAVADERDVFYGLSRGQRSGHAPSVSLTLGDKPIGGSKIYFGASGSAAYLVRQNDLTDPTTNRSLWRFDGGPRIRAPLSKLSFLTATGSASWRVTRWLETIDPNTGEQVPVALTRQIVEMRAQVVGPVLARVFQTPNSGYASRFKHVIEPSFTLQRTTPFRQLKRVVINDYGVDGIVGGVTSLTYGVTNRVLARRRGPAGPDGSPGQGIVREILSVALTQTYYSNALAASYDPQYQSSGSATSASPFSPLRLTAISRPADHMSGRFQMEIDPKYRAIRTMGASGTLDSSRAQVTAGWSKRQVIPGLSGYSTPDQFLNATTTIKTRDNRLGGTYGFNLDVHNRTFLQQRIVAYYNSQCCGILVDWQSISTPLLSIPSDRRLGISFTLAGIGSFSNPLGSFGGGR